MKLKNKNTLISLSKMIALLVLSSVVFSAAPLEPKELKVEGLVNPVALNMVRPRFTARYLDADGVGDRADYYEFQLAASTNIVSDNTLWESGVVKFIAIGLDNVSHNEVCDPLSYPGSPLEWNVTYSWRIRFLDSNAEIGLWSTEDARFRLSETTNPTFNLTLEYEDYSSWYRSQTDWMQAVTINIQDSGGSSINAAYYEVKGIVKELLPGVFNEKDVTVQFDVNYGGLDEGRNDVYIWVSDNAGNVVSRAVFFVQKDTEKPSLTILEDLQNSMYQDWQTTNVGYFDVISISFYDISSSNLNGIHYGVSIDGSISTVVISQNMDTGSYLENWGVPWIELKQGTNELYVTVSDNAGNTRMEYIATVKKDTITPSVKNNLDTGEYVGKWFKENWDWMNNLNIIITDNQSKLENISYIVSNDNQILTVSMITENSDASSLTNWSIDFDTLTNGMNEIYISANDEAGWQINEQVFYIQKDIVDPVISSNEDAGAEKFKKWYKAGPDWMSSIDVDFSDLEYSKLKNTSYRVALGGTLRGPFDISSNMNYGQEKQNWKIDYTHLIQNGLNDVYAIVADNAGNEVEELVFQIYKDDAGPEWSGPNQFGTTWYPDAPFDISNIDIQFNDMGGIGLKDIEYRVFNQESGIFLQSGVISLNVSANNYTDVWAIPWASLEDGHNQVYVSMNDMLTNNTYEPIFTINKDETMPSFSNNETPTATKFLKWYRTAESWMDEIDVDVFDYGYSKIDDIFYVISNNDFVYRIENQIPHAQELTTYNVLWAINWDELKDGENEIYITFNDNAGNSRISDRLFSIKKDTITPDILNNEVSTDPKFLKWYKGFDDTWMDDLSVNVRDFGYSNLKDLAFIISNDHDGIIWKKDYETSLNQSTYMEGITALQWHRIPNGTNELYVSVNDYAGNWLMTDALFSIRRDSLDPSYNNNEVSDFSSWYKEEAGWMDDISINFLDVGDSNLNYIGYKVSNISGDSYQWISHDMDITEYTKEWAISWGVLSNGTNSIALIISDNAGNIVDSGTLFSIYKDTVIPTFESYIVYDSSWLKDPPTWFSDVNINFYDWGFSNINDIDYVLSANGLHEVFEISRNVNLPSYIQNWTLTFDRMIDGVNEIWVSLNDRAGNHRLTKVFEYYKDSITPNIVNSMSYGSNEYNLWRNTAPEWLQKISINFYDEGGSKLDAAYYGVEWDGAIEWYLIEVNIENNTFNYTWPIEWEVLGNGTNNIYVKVSDNAANLVSSNVLLWILKDVITPSFTSNELIDDSKFVVDWHKSEPDWLDQINVDFEDYGSSNIRNIYYIVSNNGEVNRYVITENRSIQSWVNNWSISWGVLSNGTNNISIAITDNAGNEILSDVLFWIKKDDELPSYNNIPVIVPTSSWYRTAPEWFTDLEIEFYDQDISKLKECLYIISNSISAAEHEFSVSINTELNMITYNEKWSINFSSEYVKEGLNDVYVKAIDYAGNEIQSTKIALVRKDTIRPIVNKKTLGSESWINAEPAWLNDIDIDFSDDPIAYPGKYSGIKHIEYQIRYSGQVQKIVVLTSNTIIKEYLPNWNILWTDLSSNENEIYISMNDVAGNTINKLILNIKKDVLAPTYDNREFSSFDVWYESAPEWMWDIAVSVGDKGNSMLNSMYYGVSTVNGAVVWHEVAEGVVAGKDEYDWDWPLDWAHLSEGTNNIYIRVFDNAGNETTSDVLFHIKKDSQDPSYNSNEDPDDSSKYKKWFRTDSAKFDNLDISFFDIG